MNCPANPPPPTGFRVWRKPVPTALTQWAMDLRDHINGSPYGQTWSAEWSGQPVIARKDFHTWTNRKQADGTIKLVTGLCIPGITLYEPLPVGATPGASDGDLATLDANAAVYGADDVASRSTNWPLVAVSGVAIVATVAAFVLAIKVAGRPRLR